MRKQLTLVLMLVLAIAMVGTALTYAGGRSIRNGGPRQGDSTNLRDSLTEEQQTALHEMVTEMREAGATREEIREAVGAMLEEYGVELPEKMGQRSERSLNFHDSLTEEQQTALHEMVTGMREAGATREEIREARRTMLEGYGIELPEDFGQRGGGGLNLRDSLTEDQLTEIQAKVTEMKESGAAREEIREAVGAMFEAWGVELPDRTDQRPRLRRPGLRRLCADLTDDQRAAIRTKVTEMREAGAAREGIREAVGAMLEEFGVELPVLQDNGTMEPSARITATTAVQSASWGQIKSRMK